MASTARGIVGAIAEVRLNFQFYRPLACCGHVSGGDGMSSVRARSAAGVSMGLADAVPGPLKSVFAKKAKPTSRRLGAVTFPMLLSHRNRIVLLGTWRRASPVGIFPAVMYDTSILVLV